MDTEINLSNVRALFLDLSGVLYEGDTLVGGAVDAVSRFREQKLILRFVTNTATKSTAQILEKLHGMGIPLEDDELFTAPMAARALIRKKGWRPHCLVHEQILLMRSSDLPEWLPRNVSWWATMQNRMWRRQFRPDSGAFRSELGNSPRGMRTSFQKTRASSTPLQNSEIRVKQTLCTRPQVRLQPPSRVCPGWADKKRSQQVAGWVYVRCT